jgi:hypothetical protein
MVMVVTADRGDVESDISKPTTVTTVTTVIDKPEPTEVVETTKPVEITIPDKLIPEVTEAPTEPEPTEEPTIPEETIPETEPTQAPTEPIIEYDPYRYYNVPLDYGIQEHIFTLCDYYGIDYEIVIAMIYKESYFTIDIIGDNGNAFGLMQIQPRWHQARMDKLGVTDLLDPYQNITVGIDYFAECIRLGGGSIEYGLMAYNGGPSYASELWANGEISYYAQVVLQYAAEYAGY